jgi:hypothetical protein
MVSGHEPNIVMKDNDLKYKLRLTEEEAKTTVHQLEQDAIFLSEIGAMDYSLLGEIISFLKPRYIIEFLMIFIYRIFSIISWCSECRI